MGMTHGEPDTYPRTADVHGLLPDRATCSRSPKPWSPCSATGATAPTASMRGSNTRSRIAASMPSAPRSRSRAGVTLEPARPFTFTSTGDRYGWTEGEDGRAHLTLFVENGRVRDVGPARRSSPALRRIAEMHDGDFRLTAEPEPHHRQCADRAAAPRSRRIAARARPAGAAVRAAAQLDGLRRAADLRAGAGRERALSAGPASTRSTSGSPRTASPTTTSSSA